MEDELSRDDRLLSEADLKILLIDEKSSMQPRETIVGYPTYPLYREIGNMLYQWMENKYVSRDDIIICCVFI